MRFEQEVEPPTLKVRKWKDERGQVCYQYDLERIPMEVGHWKNALAGFRNSSEAEFRDLMAEVAGFFSRIEEKLYQKAYLK